MVVEGKGGFDSGITHHFKTDTIDEAQVSSCAASGAAMPKR
jgi:hypothetical protein